MKIATDKNTHLRLWVNEYMLSNECDLDEAIDAYAVSFPDREEEAYRLVIAEGGHREIVKASDMPMTQMRALELLEASMQYKTEKLAKRVQCQTKLMESLETSSRDFEAALGALGDLVEVPGIRKAVEVTGKALKAQKTAALARAQMYNEEARELQEYQSSIEEIRATMRALPNGSGK